MGYRWLSVDCRNCDLKNAKLVLPHLMRIPVPTVWCHVSWASPGIMKLVRTEVADQISAKGTLSPFSVDNVVVWQHLEAQDLIALIRSACVHVQMLPWSTHSRELLKAALGVVDPFYPVLSFAEARLQVCCERLEPRVHLKHAWRIAQLQPQLQQICSDHSPVPSLGVSPAVFPSTVLSEDWFSAI